MEETISSEYIYKGKILNLRRDMVRLPNGRTSSREVVEHHGAVAIVAIINNKLILVKQYRKAIEQELLEIPAGKLEENENPKECALRELKEETGYYANKIEYICDFYSSPGFSNEKMYLYYASELVESSTNFDDDEFISIKKLDLESVHDMLRNREFKDAKTILGLTYALKLAGMYK